MNSNSLVKYLIKSFYFQNYFTIFTRNDLVVCEIYLKSTSNFVYNSCFTDLFVQIKNKNFKWFLKYPIAVIYKITFDILDIIFLYNLEVFFLLFLKFKNKMYYNLDTFFFKYTDIFLFYINFFFIFINFFLFIIKLQNLQD